MTETTQIPKQLDDLPEPARAKAAEIFQTLLKDGLSEADALEQAHQQAESWVAERVQTTSADETSERNA